MRILLLTLMMALLPLRGWVSDVMVMEPGISVTAAQNASDADCHPGHAMDEPTHSPSANTTHAECGNCSLCDICHSSVLASAMPTSATAMPRTATPATSQPTDTSAERAPGFKPPIS